MIIVSNIVVVHHYIFILCFILTISLQYIGWWVCQGIVTTSWTQLMYVFNNIKEQKCVWLENLKLTILIKGWKLILWLECRSQALLKNPKGYKGVKSENKYRKRGYQQTMNKGTCHLQDKDDIIIVGLKINWLV